MVAQLVESWIRRKATTGGLDTAWLGTLLRSALGDAPAKPITDTSGSEIVGRSGARWQRVTMADMQRMLSGRPN